MEPIATSQRFELLDVLRGFAIFGMFTVNMTADLPGAGDIAAELRPMTDRIVLILVDLLANGRFITIFSLLFGIGLCIQMDRATARGESFTNLHLRRMFGLFLIGFVTGIAGLDSVILVDYAMFGVLMLLFFQRSQKYLLAAIVICFVVAKLPEPVEYLLDQNSVQADLTHEHDAANDENLARSDDPRARYIAESYPQLVRNRFSKLIDYVVTVKLRLYDLDILGLMLLGLYVARMGLTTDRQRRIQVARRALPWLLGIGTTGVLGFVYIEHFLSTAWDEPPLEMLKWTIGWPIGMPILGLGYAAGIAILFERNRWRTIFRWFVPVGRLALSNYLFTNLVAAFIVSTWGCSLYGTVRPSTTMLILLLIFPAQVMFSRWWIERFRYGPFEWLWRSMTYGNVPFKHG